ncbi:Leucine-rich repeat protein kinase family protein [Striga hermonthica]|uniref:Leucine-rich repeat protein kinase family protein n=1 Tax=Striga hermonthica TaxID=68872 RepID=A0A9N7MWL6_STRHE|nr:Leucine-rich repeat protein kinase family protein [Striga hermonthica]
MHKERDKFLSLLLFTFFSAAVRRTTADDATVMAQLAKSINPSPPGWTGPTFCKWQGISCDSSGRVTSINLASKSLTGTIPSDLSQLSALKTLSLQRNKFSGPLPPLSDLPSLEEAYLDENNFESFPTGFLSGLTSLQTFSIQNNTNLPAWTIPDTLKDSSSLTTFIAGKANVFGQIPDIFDSLPNFQTLRLSYNNMTGHLPASFGKSGIQTLILNNQMVGFSGPLFVLGSMAQLQTVWLQLNRFSGPIPDLSACTELTDLQLRDNSLTGMVPGSLTRLPKLKNVALQNNKFQGPMPNFLPSVQVSLGTTNSFCLSSPGPCDPQVTALLEAAHAMNYPPVLADSWEGNDPCHQWNFVTCEKGSVTVVNLGRKNFTGMISPSYANLTNLKSLFLNDNNLFGTIPPSLTTLAHLQMLDLSNNNISGKIPSFASTVTVKLSGNVNIGKDVPVTYPPEFQNETDTTTNGGGENGSPGGGSHSKVVSPWVIAIPIIFFVIALSVVGAIFCRRYMNKRRNKKSWGSGKSGRKSKKISGNNVEEQENDIIKSPVSKSKSKSKSSSHTTETPDRTSDYHIHDGGNITIPIEVLREATNNFNENAVLGKGGFGIVYRGQLHDGTQIAVKRMESSMLSDKGLHEFKAEIEVLTKVRHRHLVALHGFCDNGSERLLVYEYMTQGCLGQHLFHGKEMKGPTLDWDQRVTIALDVARGVEYLHSLAQQSFIHRDLKPSNILLGDDMRAKVADFGLVRSAPDGNYSVETRLAGTFGYLAPEYAATGRVTTKVDVYAFGVILMEIITGRKALDDSLTDERSHLVTWFRRIIPDKGAVRSALDPVLLSILDEETFLSILKVAELAGHCTARESYQRPDMSHVVSVLSPLVESWKPTEDEEDDEDSLGLDINMSLPQVLQKWKANEDSSSTMSSSFFNSNTYYGTSSASSGMR